MNIFNNLLKQPEKRGGEALVSSSIGLPFAILASQYHAMNVSAAYRCTEIISDSIASMPIQIKKKKSNGSSTIIDKSPLNLLFDGSGNLSKFNLIKMLVQSVILKGNGFCYIKRDSAGQPISLMFLESGEVVIHYNKQTDDLYYQIPKLRMNKVPKENVLHFVKNSYDGVNGVSLVSYAKRSLELANNTDDTANQFFENGGNLSGILKVNSPLTAKQREQILDSWNRTYSNGSGLCVLQGNMDYQRIQLNNSDSQLLESRKFNSEDVCRFFGVPLSLLGLGDRASYASLEMQQQDFLLHTLMPYIIMFEDEFKRKLCDDKTKIIFDTNSILRTNKQAQATYYSTLLNCGVLSINEIRKDLGYNDIEGGDEHRIPYTDVNQNTINNNDNSNDVEQDDTEEIKQNTEQ